VQLSQ
jgi:hypothetical protein